MNILFTYVCTKHQLYLLEQRNDSFDIWSAIILDLHWG